MLMSLATDHLTGKISALIKCHARRYLFEFILLSCVSVPNPSVADYFSKVVAPFDVSITIAQSEASD